MQRFNKYVKIDRSSLFLEYRGTRDFSSIAKFIPRLVCVPKLEDISREKSGRDEAR